MNIDPLAVKAAKSNGAGSDISHAVAMMIQGYIDYVPFFFDLYIPREVYDNAYNGYQRLLEM